MYQAFIRNRQNEFIPGDPGTLEQVKLSARREVGKLGLRCLFRWDTNFDDTGQLSYRCGNDDKYIWAYIKHVDTIASDVNLTPVREIFREFIRGKTVWDQDRFKDKTGDSDNDLDLWRRISNA